MLDLSSVMEQKNVFIPVYQLTLDLGFNIRRAKFLLVMVRHGLFIENYSKTVALFSQNVNGVWMNSM